MPDKAKPGVPITLDKKRHLLLDLNAMVAFEEATGKNMMHGLDAARMTAKDFRAFLWASLLHADKALTLEDVGAMIHTGNMEDITNRLLETWNVAMPEGKEGTEDPLAVDSPSG